MSGVIKNDAIPVARRPARQSPVTKLPVWRQLLEWLAANENYGLPVGEAFQIELKDIAGVFHGQNPLIAIKTAINNLLRREYPKLRAAVVTRAKENPPSLYIEDYDTAIELGHTPERKRRKRDRR